MSINNEKVVGIPKKGRIHMNGIHKILIKPQAPQAKNKMWGGVLLIEKDTQVFEKQANASLVTLKNKEEENHWGTHKQKKHIWVFYQGLEIEKDIGILILIEIFI
jgi:hypothetical protein